MGCGDVYSTTINFNGNTVFRSRYSTCCCGPMFPPRPMMSCFGFGFGGFGYGGFGFWPGSFSAGLGAGVGFAAGAALIPAMPAIVKGIGQGACWLGTKVIAPAAKGIWNGIKAVGKGIGSLFHKKTKSVKED